jgi:nucleoside-diphosphate-sugar epimerase
MAVLITGVTGFVMSNLAARWLRDEPNGQVVGIDLAAPDDLAARFFAPVRERLHALTGDVRDMSVLGALAENFPITHIVHGAAVTPHAPKGEPGQRDLEYEDPRRVLEVNLLGTIGLLELARHLPALQRFVYVSSGSVYGDSGPATPGTPLPEDGYVDPRALYPISKYASELIVRRYGEMFGFSTVSVRLSGVYGPMDRDTPGRHYRCIPYRVAHLALQGKPIRANTVDGVGDYIHAGDVARALTAILKAPRLRYDTYNIAYGATAMLRELIGYAAELLPGTRYEITGEAEADIVQSPDRSEGRWGAYDIGRLRAEFGWQPRPLRDGFHDYIRWLQDGGLAT